MLTDEEIVTALQGAFDDATADVCPPSELVAATCRRQRSRHRRVRVAQTALPVALVLAVSGGAMAWHGPQRQSASVPPGNRATAVSAATAASATPSTAPSTTSSTDSALDGYHLKLPITFIPGVGPASCPSNAKLNSAELARLFTAPGSHCPFLVQQVLPRLPAGMITVTATAQPSGEKVRFYRGLSADGKFYNSYVAVRRSTGGSVYVLIDPLQGQLSLQQYAELADGTIATPG